MPNLGSVKDRVFRKFMTHESKRKLKETQINWTIAYFAAGEGNKATLKKLWGELVDLELGGEILSEGRAPEQEDEARWMQEYEMMKTKEVKLVRKDKKLFLEGL